MWMYLIPTSLEEIEVLYTRGFRVLIKVRAQTFSLLLTNILVSGSGQAELGTTRYQGLIHSSRILSNPPQRNAAVGRCHRDSEGGDLQLCVVCLLETPSASVPESSTTCLSSLSVLPRSLALEPWVIPWRTFDWWLGTLNLLVSCHFGKLQAF